MKSISHAPNTDIKQQLTSLSYFLLPWKWLRVISGNSPQKLEKQFLKTLGAEESHAFTFSAGREALSAILKSMDIGSSPEDEVIIQAYTCIVVPNAIIWNGATPKYVDIDQSYNLDPNLLEASITGNTKAIIVQHTFGYPAQMYRIMQIANKHNIPVIEDCAHSLGATIDDKPVGTFGKAALFSFGRDKIISSVAGGLAYTADASLAASLSTIQNNSKNRSLKWTLQSLMHPLFVPAFTALSGRLKIGQILMVLFQRIGLLNKVYRNGECDASNPKSNYYKLPNSLANLAIKQLKSLKSNLEHRNMIAQIYENSIPAEKISRQLQITGASAYLRYTIESSDPSKLLSLAKSKGYILGNWYSDVVMPRPSDWSLISYIPGSCPIAELLTTTNVNLPTSSKFSEKDALEVSKIVNSSYEQ